jgi:hypothetical protein
MIDKESSKHIAQTLRIIGISQFAHYGFNILSKGDISTLSNNDFASLLFSAVVFMAFEFAGFMLIYKGKK